MGEKWKLSDFIFLGSKINVDGDCSHKIKRQLLLGRKTNDKPRQHIKKQSTLPIQHFVCIVKAIVFPVVMYGCESWSIKKAEGRRIDAFELWSWRRLRAGGEGDDKGWDGLMASLTQWTWVWVISGSWWWTGRLLVLWSMGLQRVGQDGVTELTDWLTLIFSLRELGLGPYTCLAGFGWQWG